MKYTLRIITLTLLSVFFITSCDKIDTEEYVVFAGAIGEWSDGSGVTDHSQRAFLEKYTGERCVNCPQADSAITKALAQYNGSLVAVAVHDNSSLSNPYPNNPVLRTDDGNAWSKALGVLAGKTYPMALVNRQYDGTKYDLFVPTSGIESHVDPIVTQSAQLAIEVKSQQLSNGLMITAELEFLETINDQLTITLLLMEDGIVAEQLTPSGRVKDYVHNHVLRDVITDVWGADVDCSGKSGEKRRGKFAYGDIPSGWNLSNCHVVAFVSKKDTREIMNVAECHALED